MPEHKRGLYRPSWLVRLNIFRASYRRLVEGFFRISTVVFFFFFFFFFPFYVFQFYTSIGFSAILCLTVFYTCKENRVPCFFVQLYYRNPCFFSSERGEYANRARTAPSTEKGSVAFFLGLGYVGGWGGKSAANKMDDLFFCTLLIRRQKKTMKGRRKKWTAQSAAAAAHRRINNSRCDWFKRSVRTDRCDCMLDIIR